MKKRHYSTEFKLEAVLLSYKRDNIKDLANELGFKLSVFINGELLTKKLPV